MNTFTIKSQLLSPKAGTPSGNTQKKTRSIAKTRNLPNKGQIRNKSRDKRVPFPAESLLTPTNLLGNLVVQMSRNTFPGDLILKDADRD